MDDIERVTSPNFFPTDGEEFGFSASFKFSESELVSQLISSEQGSKLSALRSNTSNYRIVCSFCDIIICFDNVFGLF